VQHRFDWDSPSSRLVLDGVLDILVESGYQGLTLDEVKVRAGPAARALGSLPEVDALVTAALSSIELLQPPLPTGSLRGDLRALVRPWRNRRTRDELIVGSVLSAALHRPELGEAIALALDRPVARAVGTVLSRHLPPGEVPARVQTLNWLLHGLILDRLRHGSRSAVDLDQLVEFLVAGLDAPA
jgi:hypothetical protein